MNRQFNTPRDETKKLPPVRVSHNTQIKRRLSASIPKRINAKPIKQINNVTVLIQIFYLLKHTKKQ